MRNITLVLLLISVTPSARAAGLTPPRRVEVRVVEGSLSVLPGATVQLTPQLNSLAQKPLVAITDPFGKVHFEGLSEGMYSLQVQLSGFADVSIGPFAVHEDVHKNPHISEFVVLLTPVT